MCIFDQPDIRIAATCGLTEDEARKTYYESKIKVYNSTFVNLWYGPYQVRKFELNE